MGASQIFAVFFQRREHEAAEFTPLDIYPVGYLSYGIYPTGFTLRVFVRTHYLMFSAL